MKKNVFILFGITAIVVTAFISISGKSESTRNTSKDSKNTVNDSIPLIVMGSFLNLNENITIDSLKIKLENGKLTFSDTLTNLKVNEQEVIVEKIFQLTQTVKKYYLLMSFFIFFIFFWSFGC